MISGIASSSRSRVMSPNAESHSLAYASRVNQAAERILNSSISRSSSGRSLAGRVVRSEEDSKDSLEVTYSMSECSRVLNILSLEYLDQCYTSLLDNLCKYRSGQVENLKNTMLDPILDFGEGCEKGDFKAALERSKAILDQFKNSKESLVIGVADNRVTFSYGELKDVRKALKNLHAKYIDLCLKANKVVIKGETLTDEAVEGFRKLKDECDLVKSFREKYEAANIVIRPRIA